MFNNAHILLERLLDPERLHVYKIGLRENFIQTNDYLLNLEWPTYEGTFFDIGEIIHTETLHGNREFPNSVLTVVF